MDMKMIIIILGTFLGIFILLFMHTIILTSKNKKQSKQAKQIEETEAGKTTVKKGQKQTTEENPHSRTFLALGVAGSLATLALVYYMVVSSHIMGFTWPLLSIFGVMLLLISLTLMSVVFKAINVTSPGDPLGLPQGSIQAVIALCLVVIFLIFVIYLYGDQSNVSTVFLPNLTQEHYQSISPERMNSAIPHEIATQTGNQTVYDVQYIAEKSAASQDIAKQVITLVGTLMASVASFYFGVKAAQSAGAPGAAADKAAVDKAAVDKAAADKAAVDKAAVDKAAADKAAADKAAAGKAPEGKAG